MFTALLFSLLLASSETPAPDADPRDAAPPSTATVKANKPGGDRLVCRRETQANSRFTTKVCKTVDEWEARTEAARKAFGETQDRPMVSTAKGN